MQVLRIINGSVVSTAVPAESPENGCFAFYHGPAGEPSTGTYQLRLKRWHFPLKREHDWQKMHYRIAYLLELQYDALGNPIYLLERGSPSGDCICLLNMCPPDNGGAATLFSWSKEVTVLGKGIGRCARQSGKSGARRASEVDYPVLFCRPGAHFTWINHGLLFGSPGDCQATWDGNLLRVAPQPLMSALAERLEQRCYARP